MLPVDRSKTAPMDAEMLRFLRRKILRMAQVDLAKAIPIPVPFIWAAERGIIDIPEVIARRVRDVVRARERLGAIRDPAKPRRTTIRTRNFWVHGRNQQKIAGNIRRIRLARGMSLDALAEAVGMTPREMSDVELHGVFPKRKRLLDIAKAMEISPIILWGIPLTTDAEQSKIPILSGSPTGQGGSIPNVQAQ